MAPLDQLGAGASSRRDPPAGPVPPSLRDRMLFEPAARPWQPLAAGVGASILLQAATALLLAGAVPAAPVLDLPALVLQIEPLPAPSAPPVATVTASAASTRLADAGIPAPVPTRPTLTSPEAAASPADSVPVQSLLAPMPDPGIDAPPLPTAALAAATALPAAPPPLHPLAHLARHLARAVEPSQPAIRVVLHPAASPPASAATISSLVDSGLAVASPVAASQAARPAATPAVPSHAGIDSYEGRVRSAIQAALRYPPAAAMMGSSGRARVAFAMLDARAGDVRLVQGTGSPQLDLAALAAVRQAAYPRPPADIAGRTTPMLVWVEFNRGEAEE